MIDGSVKNPNRITKILLYSFEDPEGQWEADGDDWYRWALPVYRMPQGSWAETTGFTRQKIWFVEKVFSEDPTNPNDIDFPPWLQCYWDSQAGRWVILSPGGGGEAQFILFELIDQSSSSGSSGSSSSGSSDIEGVPDACEDRIPSSENYVGKVQRQGCNMPTVPGMDDDGNVELVDAIGLMDNRDYRDLPGRQGYAVYMDLGDAEGSTSSTSSSVTRCQWLIVSMNFWRAVSVVTDVIFGEKSITVKRRNLTVWDDCGLPDEIIEGIDCEEESNSGSSSGSA